MASICSLCDANCCKSYIVTVTSFDVMRICQGSGLNHQEFALLHEPRLLGFDPDTILDTTDGYGRYVLGLKSHPCIFLKRNRCTIHAHAPLSCRSYPFTLSGGMNPRFCPLLPELMFRLKGADIRKEELGKEYLAYKSIVKEWNKRKGERKDCIDFLLERSKD